jgi:hypothetical protein
VVHRGGEGCPCGPLVAFFRQGKQHPSAVCVPVKVVVEGMVAADGGLDYTRIRSAIAAPVILAWRLLPTHGQHVAMVIDKRDIQAAPTISLPNCRSSRVVDVALPSEN